MQDIRRVGPALTRAQKLAVVTLDEVKAQARITHTDEDELISDDIEAAYDFLSGPNGWLNGMCLLNETFDWYTAGPKWVGFELPLRPLVVSDPLTLEVIGSDLVTYSALSASSWQLSHDPMSFSVLARRSLAWPYIGEINHSAYRIRFTVGFGTAKADIPSPIRKGIKLLAAHYYANREATGAEGRNSGQEIELGLKALCGRYRLHNDHS